ncbi:hypothetical protein D3C80_1566780 [compost metagenome]
MEDHLRNAAVRQHIGTGPARLIGNVDTGAFTVDSICEQQQILLCMNGSYTALFLDHRLFAVYDFHFIFLSNHTAGL